jgi:hypothetical protein
MAQGTPPHEWPSRGREFLHARLRNPDGTPAKCRVSQRRLDTVHFNTFVDGEECGTRREVPLDEFAKEVLRWLS